MYSVLYVDDEKSLLDVGKIFLERNGDLSVDTCTSPYQALSLMKEHVYAAIISDYEMPDIDGLRFLRTIRKEGKTIPFIIFTGRGREEIVIQALNEGADFYLQKGGDPVTLFVELHHKVKLAIQSREAERKIAEQASLVKRIAEISTEIIVTPFLSLDVPIQTALQEIGRLCKADRVYLVLWDDEKHESVSITHEWADCSILPRKEYFQHIPTRILGGVIDTLSRGEFVFTPNIADMQDTFPEIYALLAARRTCSILNVPILTNKCLRGFLGLNSVNSEHSWSEEEMNILQIFGQAIISAIIRKKYEKKLIQSRELYKNVVESQTDLICRIAPEKRILFANDAFCRHFQTTKEKLRVTSFVSKIPPEDQVNLEHFSSSLTPDHPDGEIEHRILDEGGIRWYHWSIHALFDEAGVSTEYQWVGKEITEKKSVELSHARSEEKAQAIFESTGTAMMILDEDMTILEVNGRMEEISGYGREEIEGRMFLTEFIAESDRELIQTYHHQRRGGDTDVPTRYRIRFETRDHRQIPLSATVSLLPGSPQSSVSLIDISPLREVERSLQESEQMFRDLAEHLRIGICLIQQDRFVYVNSSLSSLLGFSAEEMYNQRYDSFFPDYDPGEMRRSVKQRPVREISVDRYVARCMTKMKQVKDLEIQDSTTYYRGEPAIIGSIQEVVLEKDK